MFHVIRLLIIGILIYLIYKALKWIFWSSGKNQESVEQRHMPVISGEDLVEDPYCHVYVPLSQAYRGYLDGETLYFCSKHCYEQYRLHNTAGKAREAV
ncbi:MAG: transcriptional regulator [Deltaproteobacteria bacterium]|jgi:YHS domain-containing protein|nr:transcriptional regulator [Deltaproteobacteria bacterium]